ncbi:BTAD domain-containing putative transcriptional regulator [Actinomadura kijaniata]|uniref:BTAD domain-containing putative transcriptional regulator n=1 Tax=Actinomadura kijaniata TaxID=46161 RepID=UPI00082ED14F|nr:BTAD domain-containing putative transcriptional regulator [Actinomadura kijaniata]
MRFGVLGPLAVWSVGGSPVAVREAKVRALLADLLITPGRPVSVDRLVEDLWGDRPPRNPVGTLQARVSQLRSALGDRSLVVARPPGYALDVDPEAVDAGRFAALVARAREAGDPGARAGLLAEALGLWRGPAFADFADLPFAQPVIAHLEEQRLTALEEHAEARLELGEHAVLADELAEAVARHPLRERLRAAHLLALYRAGRQSEALAGYADVRERLAEELGLDPGPGLAALHQAILEQSPSLAPPRRARGNLPAVSGELIGRDEEVAATRALLDAERLVTLTGPGGVGKTRLALEVAAGMAFPDGVWLVELAASNAEPVEVVAATLEVRDGSARGLGDALRDQRALLVLDNCEHVVDEVAELVERLLAAAPGLRVLATSQEPLGVSAEHVRAVRPLHLPGADIAPETLRTYSAVRLFVARAAAASPGFALDAGTAAPVAAICRRLDGLPLALELAATRVRALGVHELAARLDDRFRLLNAGKRGGPARQRTLRAMIDWSWEPLPEPERAVLRRLAVHADGCTLDAAEAVSGADLEVLPRLVDRSLVARADGRYRLLESVAAYCLERLREAGEEDEYRRRHARYYTGLAERALLHGPEQRDWLTRLDRESANLRLALEHGDEPLRLVNALGWYWHLRGRFNEARRSLAHALTRPGGSPTERAVAGAWHAGMTISLGIGDPEELTRAALAAFPAGGDPLPRARAQWLLTFLHWHYGDLAANEARTRECLETFRACGDRWGEAAALAVLAKIVIMHGDLTMLRDHGERALALFTELGDDWGRQEATDALSRHAETVGDLERAVRLRREELRITEELGLWTDVSFKLSHLGRLALLRDDLDEAHDLHERALKLGVAHSGKTAEEFAAVGLALVARRRGDLDAAETLLRPWLEWLRSVDGTAGTAFTLAELGFVAEQRGDGKAALDLHSEGLRAAEATGDPRAVALAKEGLAGAYSLLGDLARAAALLAEATALREGTGAPLPPAERGDVDRIRARLASANLDT